VSGEPEDRLLEAVYFDTPDLRLLAERVTLRRRSGGPDAGWHLKLPVGVDRREEVRLPLTRPPAELACLVRVFARGARVGPVALLRTHRRAWESRDDDGVLIAELVVDEVSARSVGPGEEEHIWQEVEVELGPAAPAGLLDQVEDRLGTVGLRRSGSKSKLARLLADRLPDGVAGGAAVVSSGSAGSAVVAYLQMQACVLRRCDPAVRLDRADAVHQMRVAARRLRSVLQAFGRVLDPDRTGGLAGELAWLAGELAPARDTEVMFARFEELLAGLPDELVLGPVRAELTRTFARRATEARARALAALDSDRYLAVLAAVDELLADPPFTRRASREARVVLPREVGGAYRRMAAAMVTAGAVPAGAERDAALHEARKAAKRLRYATEAAVPVVGGHARRLQRRLEAVQDLLGAHQDTAVTRATLRELAVAATAEGGNGFTYGLMHAAEAERARRAQQDLPAVWARLSSRRSIGWLTR
jgi:CHAD domain-containing protein